MRQNYTYEQLLEKIVRAKVALEGARASHGDRCMLEDPDYYGPCTCGADARSGPNVAAALRALDL